MLGRIASAGQNGQFRTPRHIIELMVAMTAPTPTDVIAPRDLQQIVKTKKTELLFVALFLRLLQTGGRAAVIVPDGVLFGSRKAHKTLRKILVEDQKLDAVVSMPSGVFKPYAGVSTAILLFTKTESGGTDHVWFYDMRADGFSLDDKRAPQPDNDDLPDILARWRNYRAGGKAEPERQRTEPSFLVPKDEIAGNDYDLSINRYKEVEYEAGSTIPRKKSWRGWLADLDALFASLQSRASSGTR